MKKTIYILTFFLLLATVSAANVCVVVDYGNGDIDSECVDVAENADGKKVLDATGFNVLWTSESAFGQMVCRINSIGTDVDAETGYCEYSGDFWNFVIKDEDEWGHSPVGLNGGDECWNRDFSWSDWTTIVHYCAQDGDLIGFVFGEAGSAPEMLKIEDVTVKVDGEKKSGVDETGGKIKNVKPGSKIELEIEIENLYSEETGIELKDVIAKGIIKKIDDGDDIEEESDKTDINAEDKETIEVEFEIPLEVKDKDYDLELTIEGEDEKGIEYEKIVEFTLEVEKEKHDIRITKAELSNPVLKCSRATSLDVNVANMGTEEDVVLNVINNELKLNNQISFELDDDPFDSESKYSTTFTITIDNEQEAGTYPVIIRLDYSSKTTEKIIELNVEDCKTTTETIELQQEPLQTQTLSAEKTAETQESASIKKAGINENYIIITFVLGLLIVIVFGTLIVVRSLR